jgi:hypothetical protein
MTAHTVTEPRQQRKPVRHTKPPKLATERTGLNDKGRERDRRNRWLAVTSGKILWEYSPVPYAVQCHCPNTGAIVSLGITAETLDDVRVPTLALKNCPACQSDHEFTKEALFLDSDAST